MKVTVNIDSELFRTAAEYSGVTGKTSLIRLALATLIRIEAGKRLIALGGSDPIPRARQKKTTIIIDENLLKAASKYSGLTGETAIIRLALEEFVSRRAARRLAERGGSDPTATLGPRPRNR